MSSEERGRGSGLPGGPPADPPWHARLSVRDHDDENEVLLAVGDAISQDMRVQQGHYVRMLEPEERLGRW